MMEQLFPAEMMPERERQLVLALLDCAGVCYDVNFTRNQILGDPVQIIDGKKYHILDIIGKPKNCPWRDMVDFWAAKMSPDEAEQFRAICDLGYIQACFSAGQRQLVHKFWTYDVLGNKMLARQVIRLYENCVTGDLLGLVYVSNGAQIGLHWEKEQEEMLRQNMEMQQKKSMYEAIEQNMPGGYHRCADAEGWPFLYFGTSFEQVVGWTRKEIEEEFGNLFINMVLPEDIPLCAGIVEEIQRTGQSNAIYRIKKKGGGYLWISDCTTRVTVGEETYYHGTLADVTAQIEELEAAKKEAEASNLAKSTFLFNISHDIRTPMNAIQGFSHIIVENRDDPVVVEGTARKIQQAASTLMALMNDVLDLARIEQGKDEVHPQVVDLYEHGRNLYEMFASDMEGAGLQFRVAGNNFREKVLCDELKLTRILMNMLSNAKKFTPAGGSVIYGCQRLRGSWDTATYRFYVKDTGIGMSEAFQKRAFQQFEQERSSTASGVAGSGLGLAIIKSLVDLMGGTVAIQSELGKGTEISAVLTFPIATEEDMQKAARPGAKVELTGKRVLLTEDNAFNREIGHYILQSMGLLVEEAENGQVCTEMLRSRGPHYYDLILMDIQMPVMDGYAATREIRRMSDSRQSSVPIIAMTANAFEEDRRKCLMVGMDGHVGKPIDIEVLRREMTVVLSRSRF